MNTPSTLIGIITKLNIEMQQKPLVGIMHHILHKVGYNNTGLACLLTSSYVKTETCLETLHNLLKKQYIGKFVVFSLYTTEIKHT